MYFLKRIHGNHLQNPAKTLLDSMNFLQTCHHQVGADCDPDLSLNCVFRAPIKRLDTQVLFDPLEEQFDPPPGLINECYGKGWSRKVVGEKDQIFSGFGIAKVDAPQFSFVFFLGDRAAEPDGLITDQTGVFGNRTRFANMETEVAFCPDHKEGPLRIETFQTRVIKVAAIHYINATGFNCDMVKKVHIMNGPLANPYKHRDRAGYGHLRMNLDSRFCRTEVSPREPFKAQVNCRRINGVDHLVEVDFFVIGGIQTLGLPYQNFSDFSVDFPTAVFIGVGNISPRDIPPDAHGITLGVTVEAGFDVTQTFTESELGEDHGQELITGAEVAAWPWHRVFGNASSELFRIQNISDLGEDQTSIIHALMRTCLNSGLQIFSNRGQGLMAITLCFSNACTNKMAA